MWIVRLALARPYTFVVLALAILLLTPVVLLRTPTDIFPEINIPVVSIAWSYGGLSPLEMEQRVTSIVERGMTAMRPRKRSFARPSPQRDTSSSATMNPTLWRVPACSRPGLPSPTNGHYQTLLPAWREHFYRTGAIGGGFANYAEVSSAGDYAAPGDHLFGFHCAGYPDRAYQRCNERAAAL